MISTLFLESLLFQKSEPSSLVQWLDEIIYSAHLSLLERAWSHTLFCWWSRSEEDSLVTECLSCLLWLWTTSGVGSWGVCSAGSDSVHCRLSVELRQLWWPEMTLCESELDFWPRIFFLFWVLKSRIVFLKLPQRISSGWEGWEVWMNAAPHALERRLWGSIGDSKSCCSSSMALERK